MIAPIYKRQMSLYGESYASAFYILAALLLAVSSAGLHKTYDAVAGMLYLTADLAILILQAFKRFQRLRSLLLFGMSFIGSLVLLWGSAFDNFHHASTQLELAAASLRFVSNLILAFASFSGLMSVVPLLKLNLPDRPGLYYIMSYILFFIFACIQYHLIPGPMSAGYIAATILWLLASNAIRLKYDDRRVS